MDYKCLVSAISSFQRSPIFKYLGLEVASMRPLGNLPETALARHLYVPPLAVVRFRFSIFRNLRSWPTGVDSEDPWEAPREPPNVFLAVRCSEAGSRVLEKNSRRAVGICHSSSLLLIIVLLACFTCGVFFKR